MSFSIYRGFDLNKNPDGTVSVTRNGNKFGTHDTEEAAMGAVDRIKRKEATMANPRSV